MRKRDILPFTRTWIELGDIILTEISQTVKDKYHMISLICESKEIVIIQTVSKMMVTSVWGGGME